MLHELSYWEKDRYFEQLDFVVIGAGITGLNAALKLRRQFPDAKILVVERGTLPTGASTKNAGFACFGSVSELVSDIKKVGLTAVLDLVAQRWEGLQRLKEIVGSQYLQFQPCGGWELFLTNDLNNAAYASQVDFLNKNLQPIINQPAVFSIQKENYFGFGDFDFQIFNSAEGQLHPANMMQRLQQLVLQADIPILYGIEVTELSGSNDGVTLVLNKNLEIQTAKTLVATNGFARQLLPNISVTPARNQVLITNPIDNLSIKGTFHYQQGYFYFRNVGNRLLLGGARNLAKEEEFTSEFGQTSLIQQTLEQFLQKIILPNQACTIAHRWSGILGVGRGKNPIIQLVHPHIGVAVRLGGMGVAIGSLAGQKGAELFL